MAALGPNADTALNSASFFAKISSRGSLTTVTFPVSTVSTGNTGFGAAVTGGFTATGGFADAGAFTAAGVCAVAAIITAVAKTSVIIFFIHGNDAKTVPPVLCVRFFNNLNTAAAAQPVGAGGN